MLGIGGLVEAEKDATFSTFKKLPFYLKLKASCVWCPELGLDFGETTKLANSDSNTGFQPKRKVSDLYRIPILFNSKLIDND